jgi:hypothetical protein
VRIRNLYALIASSRPIFVLFVPDYFDALALKNIQIILRLLTRTIVYHNHFVVVEIATDMYGLQANIEVFGSVMVDNNDRNLFVAAIMQIDCQFRRTLWRFQGVVWGSVLCHLIPPFRVI